jgi:TRL-like protein family
MGFLMMSVRIFSLLVAAHLLTGCVTAASPVVGAIYTAVKFGDSVTSNAVGPKTGESCATSILGLVATGDASVDTAAHLGGISAVSHVDHRTTNILGIYSEYCTTVHGQ